MRQIGTLPRTDDPRVFGDYLLSMGVTSRAVESKDGWAIWVHNEDLVEKARAEFEHYQKAPDDPRFHNAAPAARAAREEERRLDRQYRKNFRELSGQSPGLNVRRRPLTVALMAVCIGLFLAEMSSPEIRGRIEDTLGFFSVETLIRSRLLGDTSGGLADIHRGEVWRLITPALLHGNWPHLIFNMWALSVLGSVIEYVRGTRTLAALVLLSAVASNVGQYLFVINFYHELIGWVGISGVVYALFGYVWMKSRYAPEHGMFVHPSSVRLMILWLLLGFTNILPMANGAHLVGLIVGMLFGLAGF